MPSQKNLARLPGMQDGGSFQREKTWMGQPLSVGGQVKPPTRLQGLAPQELGGTQALAAWALKLSQPQDPLAGGDIQAFGLDVNQGATCCR